LLKKVKINTFNVQKNGEVKETFEITMYGVPYNSLNSAGKIIAGVELIQLVNKALDINFPIVIDNKESITKKFDVQNQLITLSVVEGALLGV
jgi:exonuclease SbcC